MRIMVIVPWISSCHRKRLQPFLKAGPATVPRWGLYRTAWQQFNTLALPPQQACFSSPHLHSVCVCVLEIEFKDSEWKQIGSKLQWPQVWLMQLPAGYTCPVIERDSPERMGMMPLQTEGSGVFTLDSGKVFLKILKFRRNSLNIWWHFNGTVIN